MDKKLIEAQVLVLQAHSGQYRRNTRDPFVKHLFRVSEIINVYFNDHPKRDLLRTCALLHDCVEDTWITHEYVKEHFGEEIHKIVYELSKEELASKALSNDKYIEKLAKASDYAKLIKLVDAYDNVTDGFTGHKWPIFIDVTKRVLKVVQISDKTLLKGHEKIKKELEDKISKIRF